MSVRIASKRQARGLIYWIAVSVATGTLGALASTRAGSFYLSLNRPPWSPPPWLFGPVWTILYLLMAIAAWLVWKERGWTRARGALALFVVQLVPNALWSWLFFAWRQGAASFVDIVVLWVLIALTLAAFWRIRPLAAALLAPYLLWVSFAAALNYALWQQNPLVLG